MKLSTLTQENFQTIINFLKPDFPNIDFDNNSDFTNKRIADLIVTRIYLDGEFLNLFDYSDAEKFQLREGLKNPEIETAVITSVLNKIQEIRLSNKYQQKSAAINQRLGYTETEELDELTEADYRKQSITILKAAYPGPFTNNADWGGFNVWRVQADNDFTGYFVMDNTDDDTLEFLFRTTDADDEYETTIIETSEYSNVEDLLRFISEYHFQNAEFVTVDIELDGPAQYVDLDIDLNEIVDEPVYDFTGTTMADINKLRAGDIRNYGLIGALLNLVFDNYESSDDRDALEELLVKGLDTSKYSNLENIYGNGKDKTIPPALLKQFYNIVKSFDHTLEWIKRYEYVVSQPKSAPELKIKYVAVDKSTYDTDKSGLEFTVEINGKKATGFWKPKYSYNPDGMDIDELMVGEYGRIKIFNGGGSHKSYEISSAPVKKEKQPKDLRFTGEYYNTVPMGQDFIKKIREGLNGPTKTGATLTPEFLKYFGLEIKTDKQDISINTKIDIKESITDSLSYLKTFSQPEVLVENLNGNNLIKIKTSTILNKFEEILINKLDEETTLSVLSLIDKCLWDTLKCNEFLETLYYEVSETFDANNILKWLNYVIKKQS